MGVLTPKEGGAMLVFGDGAHHLWCTGRDSNPQPSRPSNSCSVLLSYRREPPVATPSKGVNDAHSNEGWGCDC